MKKSRKRKRSVLQKASEFHWVRMSRYVSLLVLVEDWPCVCFFSTCVACRVDKLREICAVSEQKARVLNLESVWIDSRFVSELLKCISVHLARVSQRDFYQDGSVPGSPVQSHNGFAIRKVMFKRFWSQKTQDSAVTREPDRRMMFESWDDSDLVVHGRTFRCANETFWQTIIYILVNRSVDGHSSWELTRYWVTESPEFKTFQCFFSHLPSRTTAYPFDWCRIYTSTASQLRFCGIADSCHTFWHIWWYHVSVFYPILSNILQLFYLMSISTLKQLFGHSHRWVNAASVSRLLYFAGLYPRMFVSKSILCIIMCVYYMIVSVFVNIHIYIYDNYIIFCTGESFQGVVLCCASEIFQGPLQSSKANFGVAWHLSDRYDFAWLSWHLMDAASQILPCQAHLLNDFDGGCIAFAVESGSRCTARSMILRDEQRYEAIPIKVFWPWCSSTSSHHMEIFIFCTFVCYKVLSCMGLTMGSGRQAGSTVILNCRRMSGWSADRSPHSRGFVALNMWATWRNVNMPQSCPHPNPAPFKATGSKPSCDLIVVGLKYAEVIPCDHPSIPSIPLSFWCSPSENATMQHQRCQCCASSLSHNFCRKNSFLQEYFHMFRGLSFLHYQHVTCRICRVLQPWCIFVLLTLLLRGWSSKAKAGLFGVMVQTARQPGKVSNPRHSRWKLFPSFSFFFHFHSP